jgi:hypothetical protein
LRDVRRALACLIVALVHAGGGLVWSQSAVGELPSGPRPRITVPRVPRPPALDDFLEMRPPADLVGKLTKIEGFVQRDPEDGEPASQKTHVYVGYDDRFFYCIFVAFDAEPQKVRAHLSRRGQFFGDETVEVQLDTFHDERRAFSFLTNPFGLQWDAIWTEGQGFDESWDTVWQSRGKLTAQGYVVWMAIPFKSLRFDPKPDQTWGLVFVRDIPRNNEVSFWPRVSNRIEGRLNQAATLDGLGGISPGRNIWLIPYATAQRYRLIDDSGSTQFESADPEIGLDAKFVHKDRLTLDVALNPDFSQVETDEAQVTVNERFEVFFPERRPFFLENANYFETPFNLLFTRRIIDPRAGARLTGKLGRYNLGTFLIDNRAPGELVAPDDPLAGEISWSGVFRLNRDVGRQSNVGVIFTDREFGDNRNRVAGLDGRWKINENWVAPIQVAYASTRTAGGVLLEDPAVTLAVNRSGRKWNTHIHYRDVGPAFRTALGFIPRTDIRDLHQSLGYTFRPEAERLVAWGPSLFWAYIEDHEGLRLDWQVQPRVFWEFRRQTQFEVYLRAGREQLRPVDFPVLTEPRDFDSNLVGLSFSTRYIQSVGGGVRLETGRGINFVPPAGEPPVPADQSRVDIDLSLRLGRRLRIDTGYLFTRLSDPDDGGEILTNQILDSRWNWQFNPKLSLRAIFRYDLIDADSQKTRLSNNENFNADLLMTYLVNPWTAAYVGYNSNYLAAELIDRGDGPELLPDEDAFLNDARQLFFKVTYLFRL